MGSAADRRCKSLARTPSIAQLERVPLAAAPAGRGDKLAGRNSDATGAGFPVVLQVVRGLLLDRDRQAAADHLRAQVAPLDTASCHQPPSDVVPGLADDVLAGDQARQGPGRRPTAGPGLVLPMALLSVLGRIDAIEADLSAGNDKGVAVDGPCRAGQFGARGLAREGHSDQADNGKSHTPGCHAPGLRLQRLMGP